MLGSLFIWYEQGNDNIIPQKRTILALPTHILNDNPDMQQRYQRHTMPSSPTLPEINSARSHYDSVSSTSRPRLPKIKSPMSTRNPLKQLSQ